MATTTATVAVNPSVKQAQQAPNDSASHDASRTKKHRSSNVFWIKLNFTVKTARLQSLKRHKYQHLQEEALLKARGLLKNWEDGPVLLIEDLYRQAAAASLASGNENSADANELLNYTPEALALRFSLRNDPGVLDAVKELWTIDTGPRDAFGCIDQRAYTALFRRIAKSVDAEAFPRRRQRKHKRMEENIHEDWKRDSKGEAQMSFVNFFDSVFELADLWCETIQVDEYVSFLKRIRDRISEKKLEQKGSVVGKRVLRPMTKVKALDEDTSEEEEEESESPSEESEASDETSEEEEGNEDLGEQAEPVHGDESDTFAHTSMMHRFLTAKNLGTTPNGTAAHKLPHQLSRKVNSATGALSSQQQRTHSRAGAPLPQGRFSSIAHQQRNRRPSVVSTVRFGGDDSRRLGLLTNDSGDLSALIEGAAFQPSTAVGEDPAPQHKKLVRENSGGEKRMNGALARKPSGDIVIEARSRTPTTAVHVVESGIDGIFNSATKQTDHLDTSQQQQQQSGVDRRGGGGVQTASGLFASTTRNALLKLAARPQPHPNLLGSGFRDVVFNAMQGGNNNNNSSGDAQGSGSLMALASAHFDASHFGNIVGEQFRHAGAVAIYNTTAAATVSTPVRTHGTVSKSSSSSGESTGRLPSSSLATGKSSGVSLSRQSHFSPVAVAAATAVPIESSAVNSRPGPQSSSSYPSSASLSSATANAATSPLRASTLEQNGRKRQAKSSQQQQQRRKRVLPPMTSPMQPPSSQSTALYHLDDPNNSNNIDSNNLSSRVDLSSSYTTTSYVSDSGYKSSHSNVKASANNSSSLSSLDPYAKSSSSTALPWYGLRPTRDTKAVPGKISTTTKRVKTPGTTARKVDIGGFNSQQQQQRMKHSGRGGLHDEVDLNASPWDTCDDLDEGFDSDFLLERDWESFSLAEIPPPRDESNNKDSVSKARRLQKSRQNGCFGSGPRSCGGGAAPSLIVTSLGTSQVQHSFSVSETATRDENSSEMVVSASSSARIAPSSANDKRATSSDHQVQLHNQLVLLGGSAGATSGAEQLQLSKLPSHHQSQSHHQQLPRNTASREKGLAGWKDGSDLLNDAEFVLRGERKSKPSTPSSNSVEVDSSSRVGGEGGRPLLPIRTIGSSKPCACGCSRSEKRPDCSFEHCEAAARLALLGDDDVETNGRPKSPVFKMERHTKEKKSSLGPLDDDKPESETHHPSRNREAMDDVTILLNATRELVLHPRKKEDELAELLAATYAPSTRSQMMKRRYKYTFGKT